MAVILRKAVASSSRRSVGNGHVESDPVEDDVADEPVRVRGKRVARAEDDGDEDEKEDGWTIDTFVDRAIGKSTAVIAMVIHLTFTDERPDAEQMKGVADRFKEVIKKVEDGMSRATDNAKAIEDASPDDDVRLRLEMDSRLIVCSKLRSWRLDCNGVSSSARLCRSRLRCSSRCN